MKEEVSAKKEETSIKRQSMNARTLGKVIPIIPSLIWAALVALTIGLFYDPAVRFLTKATSVRVGDVEVSIGASARSFPETLRPDSESPEVRRLARRWHNIPERPHAYRILVAHDVLNEAKYIQAALTELGFVSEIGLCPTEVEEMLRRHPYDVVVSDIRWTECPASAEAYDGISFLARMHEKGLSRPTVFFVRSYKPEEGTPAFATGITNDWYEALNFVVDILSR